MPKTAPARRKGFLFDVRVLELADERGEFAGKLLAGAGADVVKIEPPGGSCTRTFGPFYQDKAHPERSLHFWHYNFGKRGVVLDLKKAQGRQLLKDLVPKFDVLVETHAPGYMESIGLGYEALRQINPRLVMASITPFGQTGPWRDLKSCDLVSLALGGIMMVCGYDPTPEGEYDTPPIAPQMWHASHIACNYTYMSIVGALLYREQTGKGQHLDVSMHQAIATNTEMDIPYMAYNRMPVLRQTGRHAMPNLTPSSQAYSKDGRIVWCSGGLNAAPTALIDMLAKHNAADDLTDPKYRSDPALLREPAIQRHMNGVMKRWVQGYKFDADVWKEGQSYGLHWAPIRKPEENIEDPHWQSRKTFMQVYHEDVKRSLTYIGAPWLAEKTPWRTGPRAPHLGEHTAEVLRQELGLSPAEIKRLRQAKVAG
jgi:crotonobetainyl-CoA:carnitine CoA-transferase CaiB-like acyl-CoA transferase